MCVRYYLDNVVVKVNCEFVFIYRRCRVWSCKVKFDCVVLQPLPCVVAVVCGKEVRIHKVRGKSSK